MKKMGRIYLGIYNKHQNDILGQDPVHSKFSSLVDFSVYTQCAIQTMYALIVPWIRPGSIPQASWYKIQYFGHYTDVYRDDHGQWMAMNG